MDLVKDINFKLKLMDRLTLFYYYDVLCKKLGYSTFRGIASYGAIRRIFKMNARK